MINWAELSIAELEFFSALIRFGFSVPLLRPKIVRDPFPKFKGVPESLDSCLICVWQRVFWVPVLRHYKDADAHLGKRLSKR